MRALFRQHLLILLTPVLKKLRYYQSCLGPLLIQTVTGAVSYLCVNIRGEINLFVIFEQSIHLTTILEILSTVKSTDISKIVEKLSSDERDTLFKYLYKGMSVPESHGISGVLLAWHEKVSRGALPLCNDEC